MNRVDISESTDIRDVNYRKHANDDELAKQREAEDIVKEIDEIVSKQTSDDVWRSQSYLQEEKVLVSLSWHRMQHAALIHSFA